MCVFDAADSQISVTVPVRLPGGWLADQRRYLADVVRACRMGEPEHRS
ncbi:MULTISPECIES: DUF5959 family protein [unclassified Streptomyces]